MANATTAAEAHVSQRQVLTAGFASLVAWAFDLFDLFILLFVASTIGPLFFPSESETLSLAAVYASFAVTLLMRPAALTPTRTGESGLWSSRCSGSASPHSLWVRFPPLLRWVL
jgi:hypothetical protein